MTQAPLVHANGAAIPAIGLGTWTLRDGACAEAVQEAIAMGYRHIDTAAMYDNEEAVGAGIRASRFPREEVFVTTKVWHDSLAPGDLERSAEASLKGLRLDADDLLLIRWPNLAIPLRGSIEALCRVKRTGLARHIGVANFTVALLEEAGALAGEPLVANQCEYHPYLDQTPVLTACRRHGLALTSIALSAARRSFRSPSSATSPRAMAKRRPRSCCAGTCSSRASLRFPNRATGSVWPRTSPSSISSSPTRRCSASRRSPAGTGA